MADLDETEVALVSALKGEVDIAAEESVSASIEMKGSETTHLLQEKRVTTYQSSPRDEDEQETVYFKDKRRKIDFILTYQENPALQRKRTLSIIKKDEESEDEVKQKVRQRKEWRDYFLAQLDKYGMEYEEQEPKYYDDKTTFVKVHVRFEALLKGAEDLLLRLPIKEVDLPRKDKPWYRDIFDMLHVKDPFSLFDPKVPPKFTYTDYFTAPFNLRSKDEFVNIENEEEFFSPAQRSAICWYLLENTQYGKEEDEVGISRLRSNGTFGDCFPLHDGPYTYEGDDGKYDNERQLLYHQWSKWTNFYKFQPLTNIRHYFGEKVGLYFAWTGFYTEMLLFASIVGIIVMIAGLFTLSRANNAPAREICDTANRPDFYMCPLCDETCDFWYYTETCGYASVSLLFDYGGTVFFAAFMALWAVLFLEFWKRIQYSLQYEWDTLGYEAAEERERPEFVQAIKRKIRDYPERKKKLYRIRNNVLDRDEYIQPRHLLIPKVLTTFSILFTLVVAVLGIVFAVIIYRLAVSSLMYRVIRQLPGGASFADLMVTITAAVIQLVFIVIMNFVYEKLATWLTGWELHRTQTEYEDSFTFKMYLFQFINFYTSIFYIAFFKGKFTGYPGGYLRLGPFRLDECSAYGCLLELTIQLAFIFLGKQALNDATELGIPFAKRLFKMYKRWKKEREGEKEEDDSFVRWERDYELAPLSQHGLFFEYLELVMQYGFVTIFVAAFPLAPFFAWVNNVIEIRLDASKFIQVFRRPVAQRAQDIGAWFYLLNFVTNLSVITNAFLIAVTSQFIDREVYNHLFEESYVMEVCGNSTDCTLGFVKWSTSEFEMTSLLATTSFSTSVGTNNTAFPLFTVQELPLYNASTNYSTIATTSNGDDILFLPYMNFTCLSLNGYSADESNITLSTYEGFYNNEDFRMLTLVTLDPITGSSEVDGSVQATPGECFISEATCNFRGQVNPDGSNPAQYWQTWTIKLAFVLLFEHLIFFLAAVLDALVPDVPQSVLDEIRREKLLASRITDRDKLEDRARARSDADADA